ncbi:PREDICTED: uncharacterized protein LOC105315317, partial [Amphimedon queenslandica]
QSGSLHSASTVTRAVVGLGDSLDIRGLDAEARHLFVAGLSGRTKSTYGSAKRRYVQFCVRAGIDPLPITEQTACCFVTHLYQEGLCPGSILVYLSALWHLSVEARLGVVSRESWPQLSYVVKGVKRENRDTPPRWRLLITLDIMEKLKVAWESGMEDQFTARLLWAVACTAFFGCFRLGELLLSKGTEVPAVGDSDIFFHRVGSRSWMVIGLRFSKTDQKGMGTKVHVSATSTDICPVVALQNYMVVRPARQGPVFVRVDGSPLLKSTFVQLVRKALLHSGVGQASYSSHSFQIGVATVAAEAGVPVHLLKAMGQ